MNDDAVSYHGDYEEFSGNNYETLLSDFKLEAFDSDFNNYI